MCPGYIIFTFYGKAERIEKGVRVTGVDMDRCFATTQLLSNQLLPRHFQIGYHDNEALRLPTAAHVIGGPALAVVTYAILYVPDNEEQPIPHAPPLLPLKTSHSFTIGH
jgi:hypothetical protein